MKWFFIMVALSNPGYVGQWEAAPVEVGGWTDQVIKDGFPSKKDCESRRETYVIGDREFEPGFHLAVTPCYQKPLIHPLKPSRLDKAR